MAAGIAESAAPLADHRADLNRFRGLGGPAVVSTLVVGLLCAQTRSAGAQATVPRNAPREINGQMVPSPGYFAALALYQAGQYRGAWTAFSALVQPVPAQTLRRSQCAFPIDAICYFSMRGECRYHLGEYDAALQDYETALQIHLSHMHWLQNLPVAGVGQGVLPGAAVPWGQRDSLPGDYPATVTVSSLGHKLAYVTLAPQFNQTLAAFSPTPSALTICVQEIVRCTCLALYRWHRLIGPLREYHPFRERLPQVYGGSGTVTVGQSRIVGRSPVPPSPNPWLAAWSSIEAGMVAGFWKPAVARGELTKAATLGGLDHPLTGYALLMLGHLALADRDPDAAETYFLQASIAAAHYGDLAIVEEALRLAAEMHLSQQRPKRITPLDPAIGWASSAGSPPLLVSLQLLAAENDYQLDQPEGALARLNAASLLLAGTNMAEGRIGARLNYLRALVGYRLQNAALAEPALLAALVFQSKGSFWQFRAGAIDAAWQKGTLNERQAAELYATVLSDPSPVDWMVDPLEALSSQTIPHAALFERWFEAALARNDNKLAVEITERLKRHRFLSTLDLGGRLLNLRWVLEAPEAALGEDALLQRQWLLARVPRYAEAALQARQIQRELRRMPLAPETADEINRQNDLLADLKRISTQQEALLRQVALERQPCALVFPPLRTTEQLQAAMRDGQSMWIFFEGSKHLHGFLLTSKENRHWKVDAPPARVSGRIKSLLARLGNYGPNRPLTDGQFRSDRWRTDAAEIFNVLLKGSKFDFARPVEELVIVPDGDLWYLPFEALVAPQDSQQSLISQLPLRYSPTAGLAVGDLRPHRSGRTLLVASRASPKEQQQLESDRLIEFQDAVAGAEVLPAKSPAEPDMLATAIDQLVVSRDIPRNGDPYRWQPMPREGKQPSPTLSDWLSLPWGGPDQVSLLGFHCAAETAGKKVEPSTQANEVFLSLCGLMACGPRTVLISRWRTAGQTNYDLVREFARELPKSSASAAWQNAVRAVTAAPLATEKEPRLKHAPGAQPPPAAHPFFWAGLLLADTGSPPADE
jgi:hypothetical protein